MGSNATFTSALPADPISRNVPRQVANAAYSFVEPQNFPKAELIHVSKDLVKALELNAFDEVKFKDLMTGQQNFKGTKPYAMCYAGHQFGNWAGQLGDGRAINIAEFEVKDEPWVLQLKGAGKTPYSRGADGLAVLRSSIREYLMSEAMFHLGVPTTRAVSLALSGEEVLRDIMYNGNSAYEKGAIVCRAAPSFVRFGNFENFAARGNQENLKKLTDYIITTFYSHLGQPNKEVYIQFLKEVADRSLQMVLHWQRVGFVHGVMNTDNMSILGLTIDYGPYGWLENYDPGWTPNTTDAQNKRYRFGNQPSIVLWNLTQLANALYPLIEDAPALEAVLDEFRTEYPKRYQSMMLQKIGLTDQQPDDTALINQLTENMRHSEMDMTLFFRNLAKFNPDQPEAHWNQLIQDAYLTADEFEKHLFNWKNWLQLYAARIKVANSDQQTRIEGMNKVNPKYVLRNYMAHLANQDAEKGNYDLLNEFFELLKHPYNEQPHNQKWFTKRPDWAKEKVGSSMLSCSS